MTAFDQWSLKNIPFIFVARFNNDRCCINHVVELVPIRVYLNYLIWWQFQSNACKHIDSGSALFASPQCIGYRGENGKLTNEMCYPSDDTILKQVKRAVKEKGINNVFIATDSRDLIPKLKKAMPKVLVRCYQTDSSVNKLTPQ